MDVQILKKDILKKYSDFNIDMSIYDQILSDAKEQFDDDNELIMYIEKQIGKFIINQIKNDNIDYEIILIDKYQIIKSQIKKNPKYKNIEDIKLNSAYEKAIENLCISYNEDQILSINILNNMKKILADTIIEKIRPVENNNQINQQTQKKELIDMAEEKKFIYDISFFKEYLKLKKISKIDFATIIKSSMTFIDNILDGKRIISQEQLNKLLKKYKVKDYNELQKNINNEITHIKEKIKKQEKKIIEIKEKEKIDTLDKRVNLVTKSDKEKLKILLLKLNEKEVNLLKKAYGEDMSRILNPDLTQEEMHELEKIELKLNLGLATFFEKYTIDQETNEYVLREILGATIKNVGYVYDKLGAVEKKDRKKVVVIINNSLTDKERQKITKLNINSNNNLDDDNDLQKIIQKIKLLYENFDDYYKFDKDTGVYSLIKEELNTKDTAKESINENLHVSENEMPKKLKKGYLIKLKRIGVELLEISDFKDLGKMHVILSNLSGKEKNNLNIALVHINDTDFVCSDKIKENINSIKEKIKNQLINFDDYYKLDKNTGVYSLIKEELPNQKRIKGVYERLNAHTEEEKAKVRAILSTLPEKDINIIKDAYGEDLDNPVRTRKFDSKDNWILQATLRKIQKQLDNFDNINKEKEKTKKVKIKGVYERLDIHTEEEKAKVRAILSTLPEKDINIIKDAYGEDLDNPIRNKKYDINETRKLENKINKIKRRLENFDEKFTYDEDTNSYLHKVNKQYYTERKRKNIYERLNIHTEEEKEKIQNIISTLSEEDQTFLHNVFGENLLNNYCFLDKKDNSKLSNIISKIKRRIEEPEDTTEKTTQEELNEGQEILENIGNESIQNLKQENISADDNEGYNIQILNEYLFYYPSSKKDIAKCLGITEDEFEKYLNGSKSANKEQMKALCTFFGVVNHNGLTKRIESESRKESKNRFKQIKYYEEKIGEILNELSEEGDSETIDKIYDKMIETGMDVEHFQIFKNKDNTKSSNVEKIIDKPSSTKVTLATLNSKNNKITPVSKGINNAVSKEISSDIKQSYKTILDNLRTPQYKDIFKYLNYEQITSASLLLVYGHSVSVVSKLLEIDKERVIENCSKVLEFYRKYINDSIDDTIRKLNNDNVLYTLEIDEKESK